MRRAPSARKAPPVAALLAAVALLATTGCGSTGRTLREPEPGATAPPRHAPAAGTFPRSSSSSSASPIFLLNTEAWTPGGRIPKKYTCDGENIPPPLTFETVPPNTVELALVVTDPDANDFVHWVVAGMPATTTGISDGLAPSGAVEGMTTNGRHGWSGPCPPVGAGSHTYYFTLYAMQQPSGVVDGEAGAEAVAKIEATPGSTSQLTGSYER